MKTKFITYLLSVFFLLFIAQTTAYASTIKSSINSHINNDSQQEELNKVKHFYVIKEVSKSHDLLHLEPFSEPVEDESHTLNSPFNLDACVKMLVVILFLGSLLSGRRINRYFYSKSIQKSSCKYILLRTIRI